MYTMTLTDGTEIEFSGLNGTNFIVPSKKEMDTSIFTDDNLKSCTFTDSEGNQTEVKNLAFIQQQKQSDGDYYVCFREKSEQEIEQEEIMLALTELYEMIIGR